MFFVFLSRYSSLPWLMLVLSILLIVIILFFISCRCALHLPRCTCLSVSFLVFLVYGFSLLFFSLSLSLFLCCFSWYSVFLSNSIIYLYLSSWDRLIFLFALFFSSWFRFIFDKSNLFFSPFCYPFLPLLKKNTNNDQKTTKSPKKQTKQSLCLCSVFLQLTLLFLFTPSLILGSSGFLCSCFWFSFSILFYILFSFVSLSSLFSLFFFFPPFSYLPTLSMSGCCCISCARYTCL